MKLFKLALESRNRASMIDDWNAPLYVVAESLNEVTQKYNDILKAELICEDAVVISNITKEDKEEKEAHCYSEDVNGYRCEDNCGMPIYCKGEPFKD